MRCEKCRTELKDGAAFCSKCGARQSMAGKGGILVSSGEHMRPQQKAVPSMTKSGRLGGMIIGIAAAGAAVAAVIGAILFFSVQKREEIPAQQSEEAVQEASHKSDGAEILNEDEQPKDVTEVPLYTIEDVPAVDFTAANYTPWMKQAGMKWDNSLFYWLEDVNTQSPEDGNIARCRLTKTLLRDAQTGELIQYEIYSDPDSGAVYKIVSVEEIDGELRLTDWYYLNAQPNFVFQRYDSVYTPTYATIDKVGERYYFNNEVMVKWRMIRVPQEVGEYTLAPDNSWYSQGDYYGESDELRQIYDETEMRILNAAHNTYDAVLSGGNIGRVQGYVRDTTGSGLAGRKIKIYRSEDNVLLYETLTDDSGRFSMFVYLDDTDCYLKTEAEEQYKEMVMLGVRLTPASLTYVCDMTLHKEGGDEYPVTVRVYPAADIRDDGEGNVEGAPVQTVSAVIREGAGNYTGDILCTVETQNGELTTNLTSGVYTVQVQAAGYSDAYAEIQVWEEAADKDIYVMPGLAEGQTGILLTWEGEADLDLTLFTPWQAGEGDMAHIGGSVTGDAHGNLLVSDNKRRCEVMYVNSAEIGSYKLFVNNYTDSVAGNYASELLSRLNVRIYLYNSAGFVAEYAIPLGQKGVVWEVAEINGNNITPAQRVYSDIMGKKWWTEDKEKATVRTKLTVTIISDERIDYEYEEYNEEGKFLRWEFYDLWTGSEDLSRYDVYEYDENGERKTFTNYYGDGTPFQKCEYKYTYVDGKLTEGRREVYLNNGTEGVEWSIDTTTEVKYDEEGRVFCEYSSDVGRIDLNFYGKTEEYIDKKISEELGAGFLGYDVYICVYDERDNLLRWETVDENGNRTVYYQYTYDSSGRVIQGTNYRDTTTKHFYNTDGQLVRTLDGSIEGDLQYCRDYYYDEHGYLVREEYGGQQANYHIVDYWYDEKGRCIKEEISYYDYNGDTGEWNDRNWSGRNWNDPQSMEGMFDAFAQSIANGELSVGTIRQTEYTYY